MKKQILVKVLLLLALLPISFGAYCDDSSTTTSDTTTIEEPMESGHEIVEPMPTESTESTEEDSSEL